MREKSVSFSIVLDEYGVTAGLITLEDIVEEIFGELRDEYDESEEDTFKELPDGSYMVSASLKLDDLDDLLHVNLDSEDYDSLGGYIIELLDHLPSEGEIAEDEHFTFKVVWKPSISFQKKILIISHKTRFINSQQIYICWLFLGDFIEISYEIRNPALHWNAGFLRILYSI